MDRRGSLIATGLIAAVLVLAGCSSGEGDKNAGQPSPSGTPGAVPKVGECHAAEASALKDHRDPSPVVACTERHTLETAAVIPAQEKITPENVGQQSTPSSDWSAGSTFACSTSWTRATSATWTASARCSAGRDLDTFEALAGLHEGVG